LKKYEAIIILKPELQGDALTIAFNEALDIIKKCQGEIESVDEWNKRPLSYKIAKKKEGFYYLVKFKTEPKNISELNRRFPLNENVLKTMITLRREKEK
jgi:small subunit ribosomal protein S6